MNFAELLKYNKELELIHENKTRIVENTTDLSSAIAKADSQKITFYSSNNDEFLLYLGKSLDLKKTLDKIRELYKNEGYENMGFSKLSVEQLKNYTVTKSILKDFFEHEMNMELSPQTAAEYLYQRDYVNVNWQAR